MKYLGDISLGESLEDDFTTVKNTGLPTTLAGTPSLSVYETGSTTQITAGITLTVDYDSKTGMHHYVIVCSAANGFERRKDYSVVVEAGTVDGVSVVGYVVARFSIANRSNTKHSVFGTFATGTLNQQDATTSLSGFTARQLRGRILKVLTGSAAGEQVILTDYATSGAHLYWAPLLAGALANGDEFEIL